MAMAHVLLDNFPDGMDPDFMINGNLFSQQYTCTIHKATAWTSTGKNIMTIVFCCCRLKLHEFIIMTVISTNNMPGFTYGTHCLKSQIFLRCFELEFIFILLFYTKIYLPCLEHGNFWNSNRLRSIDRYPNSYLFEV